MSSYVVTNPDGGRGPHTVRDYVAVGDVGSTISDVVSAGRFIIEDPALPQIAASIVELHRLEPPSPSAPSAGPGPGVGLRNVVPALRAYVYYRRNPWVGPVVIGAVLAVPFLIGYMVGKKRKR